MAVWRTVCWCTPRWLVVVSMHRYQNSKEIQLIKRFNPFWTKHCYSAVHVQKEIWFKANFPVLLDVVMFTQSRVARWYPTTGNASRSLKACEFPSEICFFKQNLALQNGCHYIDAVFAHPRVLNAPKWDMPLQRYRYSNASLRRTGLCQKDYVLDRFSGLLNVFKSFWLRLAGVPFGSFWLDETQRTNQSGLTKQYCI